MFTIMAALAAAIPSPAAELTLNPRTVQFGNTSLGQRKTVRVTLSNPTPNRIDILSVVRHGTQFSLSSLAVPFALGAGRSHTFEVSFRPARTGTFTGSVLVTRRGSSTPLLTGLHGTGVSGSLAANPPRQDFGIVAASAAKTLRQVLTNHSSAAVTISRATVSNHAFSVGGLDLPRTLPAGQSYTFSIRFDPAGAGSQSAILSILSNAPNSDLKIALQGGSGSASHLSFADPTLTFGSVPVGSSKRLTGVLLASGGNVRISSATSNSPEFKLSGISFPFTLAAGQRFPFQVVFVPTLGGAASGRISFSSNAADSPAAASVSGSGAGSGSSGHSVALRWRASASPVAGYNVYRAAQPGGPYSRLNGSAHPETSYTDFSVQGGRAYFYVISAVSSKGRQSAYSNQVKVVVP